MTRAGSRLLFFLACFIVSACGIPKLEEISNRPISFIEEKAKIVSTSLSTKNNSGRKHELPISELLKNPSPEANFNHGFKKALSSAIENSPKVVAAQKKYAAAKYKVDVSKAGKDFQFSGNLLGGIEDVSDREYGLALILNAKRVVYDGGVLDSQILSAELEFETAKYNLLAEVEDSAYKFAELWLNLDRYQKLDEKIRGRLEVLDPLITQLEKVSSAGLGDITQVARAQRTVSAIKVNQSKISESLDQAKINFENAYGSLPPSTSFDYKFISDVMPKEVTTSMKQNAPLIKSKYADYKAAEASLASVIAQNSFNIGFESKVVKPIGDSSYDSDESVGFVVSKQLFNSKTMDFKVSQASALTDSSAESLRSAYRELDRLVSKFSNNIESMDRAITLARKNAKVSNDEIKYLRKQLVIGESTLDSVLSAEARLYEAEEQEISFLSEKVQAQLALVAGLGLLGPALGVAEINP